MTNPDIVVVGGGLAALTAALFSARAGRSTLVLTGGMPGGQLVNVEKVEDFPGFPEGVAGYDLGPLLQEQASSAGAEFQMAEVQGLESLDQDWQVVADGQELRTPTVIIETGSNSRELGVLGESRL